MPVSSPLAPKSTLRHRPIGPDVQPEEPPRIARASRTQTQKPIQATTTPGEIPAWKAAKPLPARRRQRIPMVGIGIGMMVAVILVVLGQALLGWINTTWDDLHYGYPRTYQVDAVVGHGDSAMHPSHFIALDLKGQLEVIELPAGNASQAKIFVGPRLYGMHADLVPVTIQFVGSQQDMILLFQGEHVIFRNVHGTFQSAS